MTGFDISSEALKFSKTRKITPLVQASALGIPFRADRFDLVTSFDVLYERQVTSDLDALAEFSRVLRPGGLLLLRLPACDWLRGQHDLTIHTARRYSAPQVIQLLRKSGFQILHTTYANTFLFPLAVGKRLSERFWSPAPGSSDLSVEVGLFNGILRWVLSCEAPFAARKSMPFGLSVIALGKKPEK